MAKKAKRTVLGDASEEDIDGVLLKKALGYYVEESVEEYDENDNVTKRRVSVKYVPPDTAAIKAVIEREGKARELRGYTDEQLSELKEKLLRQLAGEKKSPEEEI